MSGVRFPTLVTGRSLGQASHPTLPLCVIIRIDCVRVNRETKKTPQNPHISRILLYLLTIYPYNKNIINISSINRLLAWIMIGSNIHFSYWNADNEISGLMIDLAPDKIFPMEDRK